MLKELRAIKKANRQQEPLTATIRMEKQGAVDFGDPARVTQSGKVALDG